MTHFQHAQAIVESTKIGKATRIWAFTHILPGAEIGEDCNICDHVFIENDVKIGDRVTIKSGVQLWDGIVIEDDVFIGPNATFTNDLFPRSKHYLEKYEKTVIRQGASVGANATILARVTIGSNAMIGAGSVVTRDVPPNAIVVGNPATIKGYVDIADTRKSIDLVRPESDWGQQRESTVAGVKAYRLPQIKDMRGNLSFAEHEQHIPFIPKRYFLVFDVPSREIRGEHAHRKLHQFLVCVRGSLAVVVDDGSNREEFLLDSVQVGIYIPPMIWSIQYKYTTDAMLLVLASDVYDAGDYIRDYDEFLKAKKYDSLSKSEKH